MNIKRLTLFKHKKTKIGIAFGGGGMRGFVHLGAIKALEEYGLSFDFVAGTSVGALIGAFYAQNLSFSQMYNISKNIDMKTLRTNLIPYKTSKTDGLEKIIIDNLGDIDVSETKIPFATVCTNLVDTKEYVITKGKLSKAVAGSCCLPYVFYPVVWDNKHFVDGGLHNTIPADIPKLLGCDYVVAIDANPTRSYGTEETGLFSVIGCSFRILMENNADKGYRYADVMVTPNTRKYNSLKKEGYDDMIDEGYRATLDVMPKILQLFNSRPRRISKKTFENKHKQEKDIEII